MQLTRFKETYNLLTNSKAYSETGQADNSKINKNVFTPHNLRRICFDANGVYLVYFTTNNSTQRLVDYKPFKYLQRPEELMSQLQQGKEPFKTAKPMINALFDNIVFSNVEEILLFTGNFNPQIQQEYNFELMGIDKFGRDQALIKKSFKRLESLVLVDSPLIPEEYLKLDPAKTILEKLQGAGISYKTVKLQPERDELGLLKSVVLDSAEYKPDKQYDPNEQNKNSVDCRLSKHFYDLEQAKKKAQSEPQNKDNNDNLSEKQLYIKALLNQGFKHISNKEQVVGNFDVFSKTLSWVKSFCTEQPNEQSGYKYKTCEYNQTLLKSKGIADVKNANIWNPAVFNADEDLRFRLFVKENDLSFTILIKLPVDLDEFAFNTKDTVINNICAFFSNRDRTKGKVFQSSTSQRPALKGLNTYGIDTIYNCIELVLVKDLMNFKKSAWGFLDYLKACNGDKNAYSAFPKLPLGERIVVGVKPNALKIENFNCSGQQQTSGIICGAAGSGKSALMDNLIIQFLALRGDYGNGAVVLMDAKQELPALWRPAFKIKGIPFYSFDGGIIKDQESIKQKVKKGGKEVITGFNQPITQEVGGMIFMATLYEVVQNILKRSGYKDVKEFNKANVNIDGITRLPRIAIMIDEMNTFSINTKGDAVAKGIIDKITGGANLTRTSGFMWFLCGQDIPKSIISAEKRGSFKYNIFGAMPSERYEYFGVVENEEVKKYEAKYGTAENPRPIMSQGSFYAGQQGSTELIRSMFLADDEKDEALTLLNSQFEGMYEFDNLVKYALANHIFDDYTYGVGNKNNIIYAVLRDIGIIADAEFIEATERLFGNSNIEVNQTEAEDIDFNNFVDTPLESQQFNNREPVQQNVHQQNNAYQGRQQQAQPQQAQSTRPVARDTYNQVISIPNSKNPFINYGSGDGVISTLNTLKEMTKIILKDVETMMGSLDRITSLKVTNEGILIINEIAYQPQFEPEFLATLPFSIKNKVATGCMAELFDFSKVYMFKNLQSLVIDNHNIAQGRCRREMYIAPKKRYSVLFKRFGQLQYIKVGDVIYQANNPDAEDTQKDTLPGYGFIDRMKNLFTNSKSRQPQSDSRMNEFWNKKSIRTITNAVGYTLGTKLVLASTLVFGPWSLLFATLFVAGKYSDYKSNKQNSQNGTNNNYTTTSNSNKPQNTKNKTAKRINGGNPYYNSNRTNK